MDPSFAKKQLDLLTREWYMKPDGQIPAYEWNFSDVNPPVHAWYANFPEGCDRFLTQRLRATFRVFKIERKTTGKEDLAFLERVFQKLLLNFTWYALVSQESLLCLTHGLGGLTERIKMAKAYSRAAFWASIILALSIGLSLYRREALYARRMELHGWLSTASICMSHALPMTLHSTGRFRLNMALELAKHNAVYEDIASKFFEVRVIVFDELSH